jgi:uncharacterized protein (DUF58 family)
MGPITLGHRQLYLLPTRHGMVFALLLFVLLLASINYNNGLAYGLTFLLASLAVVSMLHTQRNLHRLTVAPGVAAPVFAGETAVFDVCLTNPTGRPRYGVVVEQGVERSGKAWPWRMRARRPVGCVDIDAGETACVKLALPAAQRGRLAAPAFSLATLFPLGLLYSWSRRIEPDQSCIVYPKPAPTTPRSASAIETGRPGNGARAGDDFAGLREYRPGDSPRHIHWKAVARGQGWYTKEFGGGQLSLLWLDWDSLDGFDTETRLSILTRWVLDAERDGELYGLIVPGTRIAPGNGEAHEGRCLAALALFGQ